MKKIKVFLVLFSMLLLSSFAYVKYHGLNINDVGLGLLNWGKKITGKSVDISALAKEDRPTIDHQPWSDLLQQYVDATGKVNYEGFIQDSVKLSQYLELLSKNPPGQNWTDNDKLAYWINTYNAFTVQLIVDHYPLKSIKDVVDGSGLVNSPWDLKFFKIGNVSFDLGTIEHEILRKEFKEPRIHFAVNCASYSCPKLLNEAYLADRMEEQLDAQAKDFLHDERKNIINKKETKLSKIFDWFESDFKLVGGVSSFIEKNQSNFNPSLAIEYLDYNWELNN